MRGRVLLALPHAASRTGLRLLLQAADFEVAAEAARCRQAVQAAEREPPAIAIVAADLPGGARETVAAIAAAAPGTRIVVLSGAPHEEEMLAVVLAGADGYLAMNVNPIRLPAIFRAVAGGELVLPRHLTGRILDELRGRDRRRTLVALRAGDALTDREWEVLQLLADGHRTSSMAERLGIAEVTVRRHVAAVVTKLGVGDRREAAAVLADRSRD